MASSPTSSSYSAAFASSSSSSTGKLSGLPVTAQRDRIVEKIQENRVTLIVGETGCGKSSQVPQFLLQENMEPILCTQPRRFAVVAVARMVAKARNCEVGGEVGYHIGHSRVFSSRSKIVFKTAGVLLDEIRDKGLNALKYKVIILDEVHERSVESDLVLVCVKQLLLKNVELRLVLMSATADISRYRDYFKELGRGERVEVLGIPISPQHTIFQGRVLYLEQVTELLGMKSDESYEKYCSGPSPITADAEIKLELHKLIHNLVLHIHKNEPDIEKSILVFLPTYYSLEQQWSLLKPFTSDFRVHILHRSVDTEQALKAMKICKSHRKVILATNIAESSVTIPKVAFVIDSCRSLQVFWDNNRKTDAAELVWVSKSQAEQRKGRTGRTCDGQIYRLVTKVFFNQLQEFEPPSILRLSLRQQVLLICCADSKAINDPKVLLQKALDPPDPEVVEDALSLLFHIRALEKASPRGRSVPTFYGRLLASFSLSFDASVLILKFGDIGMLREGILVGILMDMQPLPILRPFGQEHLFVEYTNSYYSGDTRKTGLSGRKELLVMGNVCAFQFWQRVFKDKHRLGRLKHLLKFEEVNETESLFSKIEEEWCLFHNLVQSSLHQVSEIYEDVLSSLHRFRPKFLVKSDGVPYYYDPYEFRHTCLLQSEQAGDTDALAEDDDDLLEPVSSPRKCVSLPFVASSHFQNDNVAEKFAAIVKEIRVQFADTEEISGNQIKHVDFDGLQVYGEPSLCRFFLNGSCNRGSQCMFSHSLQAKRPICKFFFSLQGCRKGESCYYSHDLPPSPSSQNQETSFGQPEDQETDPSSLLRLLPKPPDGRILLLDDTNFHFSSHLSRIYDPSSIISTTSLPESSTIDPSLADISIQWGLSHPYQTIISETGECSIPWNEVKCVLWVPMFHIEGENPELYRRLLKNFFDYLAIRILADALHEIRVVLTMKNIRFSQLQVEKLARESFFFLKESFPFDESSFGGVFDEITTNRPMVVAKPISYVFDLHPPTDIQFGDYTAVLRQCLNSSSIS